MNAFLYLWLFYIALSTLAYCVGVFSNPFNRFAHCLITTFIMACFAIIGTILMF